jgi:predicted transcriptional regulator
MAVQGTQLKVLETIADIQEAISAEEVEDTQIAEEIDLDIGMVRSALDMLAQAGYVKLEKTNTLSGMAYSAFLTNQGNRVLQEGRGMVSER